MTPLSQQCVRFRTSPQALFDPDLDSRRPSLSTGAPATISRKVDGKFKAFEGQLEGKTILIIPGRQIVHFWRATHFKKADWSILILTFSPVAGGAQVDLVHVGVPAYDHQGALISSDHQVRGSDWASAPEPSEFAATRIYQVNCTYPPPTNCTISNLSPLATRVSSHFVFARICKLHSIATRPAFSPS
jgi:hypothetical protein